jgi:hypothetical protein
VASGRNGSRRTDKTIENDPDRDADRSAFDQMNGCAHIEAVGTGRYARSRPRATQGDARRRKVERAMGIEPKRTALPKLENMRFGAMADSKCD